MSNFLKKILDNVQIEQKIRRIAFEIYERNIDEETIVLAGVEGGGYVLADKLKLQIEQIASMKIEVMKIALNKDTPHANLISLSKNQKELEGKIVIIVDDVLNTGRTLAYSLSPFFGVHVKKIQVVAFVNRGHHSFPIAADYVGYALSTSLNEHIQVVLEGENAGVFLS